MVKKRKRFTNTFKAKVSLEAIKEEKTITELSQEYGIHPNQIIRWKKHTMEHLSEIFGNSREMKQNVNSQLIEQLYSQIGKLKVELDWLKKKYNSIG